MKAASKAMPAVRIKNAPVQIAEVSEREGFNNIFQSALVKVKGGLTSLDEVDRVTSGH